MNDAELVKLSGGDFSRHELFQRCDIALLISVDSSKAYAFEIRNRSSTENDN